jgi:26S proteasome regulatory subunit N3
MDVDVASHTKSAATTSDLPETDVYFRLLVIYVLLDSSSDTARKSALQLAKETATKIQQLNRRTMDPVGAKIWWAYGRAYELVPGLEIAELRP